jgi:hypothetical protein
LEAIRCPNIAKGDKSPFGRGSPAIAVASSNMSDGHANASGINLTPSEWGNSVTEVVEEAIDSTLKAFLECPYRCRSEATVQADLYGLLKNNEEMSSPIKLADPGRFSVPSRRRNHHAQPLQLEWPTCEPPTASSPKESNRGRYDIAIVSPRRISFSALSRLKAGAIPPEIIIEISLNSADGADHFEADYAKVLRSGVPHAYLLHLSREVSPRYVINKLILDTEPHVKVAYGHWSPQTGIRFKRVASSEIQRKF